MVKMTTKAAEQLKEVLKQQDLPQETLLRVDVEQTETEGKVRLALRLDPQQPRPDDEVQETEGARLAVHKELSAALGQGQLDYREEAGGFVFERAEPTQ